MEQSEFEEKEEDQSDRLKETLDLLSGVGSELTMDQISLEIKYFVRHLRNRLITGYFSVPLGGLDGPDGQLVWCINPDRKIYDLIIINGEEVKPAIECKIDLRVEAHRRLPALGREIKTKMERNWKNGSV